ncbi:Iba57p [Sporobolomyces salmoneus]|uniref:Iba57p n=1 Tax=Sporobolomyces salmoneus TaxID=183962 RepID=UPI00317FED6B
MIRSTTTRLIPLRRAYSTGKGIKPFLFTPLDSTRSLLSIQGRDSTKFLQGLVSNDVRKIKQSSDEAAKGGSLLYAGLLQADGRYMSDIFLHSHPSPSDPSLPSYFLDHPSSQSSLIRSYLKRHVLRSKLKLAKEIEQDWQVVQVWRNLEEGVEKDDVKKGEEWLDSQKGIERDSRVPGMGWRYVKKKDELDLPSELFQPVTPSHYHLHRLLYSVPENPSDFPALPLEANLELMQGVDYKKGCYVGQELTARTYFKGVVRKRGVGVRLFREGEEVPTSFMPSLSPSSSASLIPSPKLYPTPPPGSSLIPLTSAPSKRAPRPAGKLGSTLPLISPQTGSTLTIGFGSIKLDALDQVFKVVPPTKAEEGEGAGAGEKGEVLRESEEGEGEDGGWLAKGFLNEWTEFRLEELEISKGS